MDQPIACSLTAEQHRRRISDLAALARQALESREQTADGERLTFTDTDETARRLRAVVTAEASCCPFLHMHLHRRDAGLVLDIAGPEQARPVIAELFA